MYRKPELTQYYLNLLTHMQEGGEEDVIYFMERVKMKAKDAFKHIPDKERQAMIVAYFCKGLRNRTIAPLVSTQANGSTAAAVGIAAEALSQQDGFENDNI